MGRPREFDDAGALDAAVACFWHRGYEATTVRELAASMGICGTSLYNAFGDKRALFRQALDRYLDASLRARIARLEDTVPPKQAVRDFFADAIARSLDDPRRRGCLLINSAVEVAPHDPELAALIAARLGEIEAFFRGRILAAQAERSMPLERDAESLARLLLGALLGIRVLARCKPERALLEDIARPALALLD
jgi:TetR/AcrR family transcriptional repressor of nem operon